VSIPLSLQNHLHCLKKNIPDIFDSNVNKNYQIFIIFGESIPDTTCHQMIVQFLPRSISASALPRERKTSEISIEIYKKCEKKSPTLLTVT